MPHSKILDPNPANLVKEDWKSMASFNYSRVLSLKKVNSVTMSNHHFTKSLGLYCKSLSTTIFPLMSNHSIISFKTSKYSREHLSQQVKYEHPYQIEGPGNVISVDIVEDNALVRVVMPRVSKYMGIRF